ncbi:MAG: ABC transporter ATP-binding protein [Clostridia bacterium]|nr:ABC transporter ATP-binding protein [Clostridia bacterium]
MIKADGVTKKFGDFCALDSVNLNAGKGSVYGLVGPNGAGKTTFIKCLMGIYKNDEGKITVDERSVSETCIKQKMVYIGDDLYFFPGYTIRDMAKYYAGIYENFSWEEYERIKSVFGLDEKAKLKKLSKGMKKQAAFWIGISCCPEVLVLDEPVDGLDPVMRKAMWSVVLEKVAEGNLTVLVSSHNLRELEDVCDHVGIMHEGKLVIEKTLDDVKGNIHKLQIAFEGEVPVELMSELTVLKESKMGSVSLLIVRGTAEDIKKTAEKYNPLILDILPLTLEEVFIYELGGMGYVVKDVISQ